MPCDGRVLIGYPHCIVGEEEKLLHRSMLRYMKSCLPRAEACDDEPPLNQRGNFVSAPACLLKRSWTLPTGSMSPRRVKQNRRNTSASPRTISLSLHVWNHLSRASGSTRAWGNNQEAKGRAPRGYPDECCRDGFNQDSSRRGHH